MYTTNRENNTRGGLALKNKSSQKGKNYERQVAKHLSELYDETFIRTIGSGAYIGGKNNHRTSYLDDAQQHSHRGDITCPSSWVNANIECKSYADLAFHQLLQQNCKQLNVWIAQTREVARDNDVNIIIFKITRKGQFVCVQDYPGLNKMGSLHYLSNWYIYDYDYFFANNKDSFRFACITIDV